jgi:AcrR family transcriptional regulator
MTRHMPEQARREQILSAARRCFIESGYHPTRMDDIARVAGLSKGGVYFHFKSKREVFDSLVQEEYDRTMAFIRDVTESDKPIAEKMQVLAAHYLQYFQTATDAPRFFVVMGEMALRDPDLARGLLDKQQKMIDAVAKLIDQGIREGFLKPVDSKVVAAILKALLDGVEALQALNYPIDHDRYLGVGMELVMGGLVKR